MTDKKRAVVRAIVVAIGITLVGAVVLWLLPSVLTSNCTAEMCPDGPLKAANDTRTPIVAYLVAVGAAGTLWFTARTYLLGRESQITDRYGKSVGQLGDTSSPVRIGGVYALERIAGDSPKDLVTIVRVLGAFVREQSKEFRERSNEYSDSLPPEEIKSTLRVLARLVPRSGIKLDLRGAYLRNTDLSKFLSSQVIFDDEAVLTGAQLPRPA